MVWSGDLMKSGYSQLGVRRDGKTKTLYGHRVMYESFVGPIPEGLHLDHLCRNRACVRPDHLEPVTNKENVHRGLAGPKSRCKRGHAMTSDNRMKRDRKSTRLNSSHVRISYAVFCLKKK